MRSRAIRCSTPRSTRLPESICRCASSRIAISSAAAPWSPAAFAPSLRICFWAVATALAKRACSSSTWEAEISYSGMCTAPVSTRCAVPSAMPEETPTPSKLRSLPTRRIRRSVFIELASDQIEDGGQRRLRLGAAHRHLDVIANAGGEHHQPHDRAAVGGQLAAPDLDLRLILIGELDELCRRTRMQPALVEDGRDAAEIRPAIHLISLRRRPAAAKRR